MSAWDQMQTPYFRELYDRWKTQEPETNEGEETMDNEEIFQLAEFNGWLDDFGRWNFKDDGLIAFATAIQKAERDACAKVCADKLDAEYATGKVDHNEIGWTQACAAAIRARGEK